MKGYRILVDFARDRSAAIAPMYAIALFGLITIAGVGWDYSRLMTMDSELQNAADQAALAAATQLTGVTGARANARNAAIGYLATAGSDWANETKLSNDGGGRTVGGLTFEFFESWPDDSPGPVATTDADARYVRVTVAPRVARYALTAIGGVLTSGGIRARAVATLEGSTCNVPPLMVCAPPGNTGWPSSGDIGSAVDLRQKPQVNSDLVAGNFDLLQIEYDNVAQRDKNQTLGLNSDVLGCTGREVVTRPGFRQPENRAINTRFGVYANGAPRCDSANSDFCPGDITRNDLVRRLQVNDFENETCANTPGGTLISYTEVPSGTTPPQGLPLDTCQADGSTRCTNFGDGDWPADTYLDDIHGTTSASIPDLDGNGRISRYEVYQWEREDSSRNISVELGREVATNGKGTLYCSAPRPIEGDPVSPSTTQKDRRIVTTAVVDCEGKGGRFDVVTTRYIDLFLLGPVTENGGESQLRAELIGPARRADGRSGFQTFGRKKAVLVQ